MGFHQLALKMLAYYLGKIDDFLANYENNPRGRFCTFEFDGTNFLIVHLPNFTDTRFP